MFGPGMYVVIAMVVKSKIMMGKNEVYFVD